MLVSCVYSYPHNNSKQHTHTHCSNYCTTQGSLVDDFAQITALNFSYPLLFVGTRGGHLLSFRVQEDLTVSPDQSSRSCYSLPPMSYRIAAATYCSAARPIINIHPTPVPSSLCPSPLPPTPTPTMHVLVVLGNSESEESNTPPAAGSLVQLYELSGSPRPSPLTSPMQSVTGALSSMPSSPVSFSFSGRRDSLSNLGSSLPKLSLVSAARDSSSFLPLPDSD